MKVLLRDDVAGVGRRGDIVKVAGGFARNFLLPEGRAIVATEGIEGQAEQMRRGRDLREAQDRSAAEAQASLLAGAVIPISARAGVGRPALRLDRRRPTSSTRSSRPRASRWTASTWCCRTTSRRPARSTSRWSCSADVSTVVTLEVTAASRDLRPCHGGYPHPL